MRAPAHLLARGFAACLAAWGATALAQQKPAAAEFQYHIYPEWKVQEYGTPSPAGTRVGTMGTLRNDTEVLSRDATPRERTEAPEWSNSYVGVRGAIEAGPLTWGYNVQGLVDLEGSVQENFRTRDTYVWVEHAKAGRLVYGQMDTMYKEAGDVVSMLGLSSGNFVSTSRVLSGTGWRGAGVVTFHNRVNRQWMWISPQVRGFNVGLSHSVRPVGSAPHLRTTLDAAALQWRDGPWYAAVATEVHRGWLPVSLNLDPSVVPAATSIRNTSSTATSRDQAWRVTGAWVSAPWRLGVDLARLRYTEDDTPQLPGKFRAYANTTLQVSAEYRVNRWLRVAANHARASAGSCTLSGGVACSTAGLGGRQTSLGALFAVNDIVSLFALAAHTDNGVAAQYGPSAQGASTTIYAVGVRLRSN